MQWYNNGCFGGMKRNVPEAPEGTGNIHGTVSYQFSKKASQVSRKNDVLNK